MAYPEFIKIEAVRFYFNAKSAREAAQEIKDQFGVMVSERSIQAWAKDEAIIRDAGGPPSLFVNQSININTMRPSTGQKFNIQDFVEQNKAFFDQSSKRVDEILAALYKSVDAKQIKAMDTKDKLNAIAKLEKLKMDKYNFLLGVIAKSADDEDDLKTMLNEIVSELNGDETGSLPDHTASTVATEVVDGG